jgi:molybdopterin/thiamine biosynthesis adenylyltransferase
MNSLWAASGQSALESSRILVLSASATSTSILKNLVLPGIGHFTILDSEAVTSDDAGNNFFLEGLDSVGKNRAEEAVRLLREMNESVSGDANTQVSSWRACMNSFLNLYVEFTRDIGEEQRLSSLVYPHYCAQR